MVSFLQMPISTKLLIPTFLLSLSRYSVQLSKNMSGELLSVSTSPLPPEPYSSSKHSVAYVTVPKMDQAKELARSLVSGKFAACVNIIPSVTSFYEWENEVQEDSEILMMIKTRTSRIDEVIEHVKANHPYSVCEVIAVPIEKGNKAYLKWINDVVPEKKGA